MSVTSTISLAMPAIHTLTSAAVASANNTVTLNAYDESHALSGTTTPPITTPAYFLATLVDGALTIDLTALSGTNGATVSGSGLKVQALHVKNLGANALTIGEGVANGYELAGNAWTCILAQNQEVMFYLNDAAPDIDGTHKNIDLAGTTTQTSEWSILMG